MRRRTVLSCLRLARADRWLLSRRALFAAPPKGVQVRSRLRRIGASTSPSTGKPFTSYIWPTTLKKPVLYPIVDADGVTRDARLAA